jgi:hypothetical protein
MHECYALPRPGDEDLIEIFLREIFMGDGDPTGVRTRVTNLDALPTGISSREACVSLNLGIGNWTQWHPPGTWNEGRIISTGVHIEHM